MIVNRDNCVFIVNKMSYISRNSVPRIFLFYFVVLNCLCCNSRHIQCRDADVSYFYSLDIHMILHHEFIHI